MVLRALHGLRQVFVNRAQMLRARARARRLRGFFSAFCGWKSLARAMQQPRS
jgi:hypothetical protein